MQPYRTSISSTPGAFSRSAVALSAAVGTIADVIRVETLPFEPPRAPAWARPAGRFARFRRPRPSFRRRGAFRARFRREIGPAVGRRLAPPPRPEKRRRGGAEPAQTPRGRGGAPRRRRAGQARRRARAGGTGILGFRTLSGPGDLFAQAPCGGRGRPAVAAGSLGAAAPSGSDAINFSINLTGRPRRLHSTRFPL